MTSIEDKIARHTNIIEPNYEEEYDYENDDFNVDFYDIIDREYDEMKDHELEMEDE